MLRYSGSLQLIATKNIVESCIQHHNPNRNPHFEIMAGRSYLRQEISNFFFFTNKMKNKKYHTVRTVPKFNRKLAESVKIDTPHT